MKGFFFFLIKRDSLYNFCNYLFESSINDNRKEFLNNENKIVGHLNAVLFN